MEKHTIERTNDGDIKVEASSYVLADGYFWFRDQHGEDVFTIRASDVYSVKRDASK